MKRTSFKKSYNKFQKMAEHVASKNSYQCRSHHQKMMLKYKSIEEIVANVSLITSKISTKDKINAVPRIFD